ncbi:nucleotidyltransferase domain-containing protein [bacterium]|nr:nucleotidyltransferase domain-containing protein [bacterium]
MPTLELKPEYLHRLQTLLREHVPWAEVWAYGSRVSNSSHEASDLDLVLRNPEELSQPYERLGELKEAFSESNIPILIDILDWARIPAPFRKEIEGAHVVVQEAPRKTQHD